MQSFYYVGLDVHKKTVSYAVGAKRDRTFAKLISR